MITLTVNLHEGQTVLPCCMILVGMHDRNALPYILPYILVLFHIKA
jgi:hypothetical protein